MQKRVDDRPFRIGPLGPVLCAECGQSLMRRPINPKTLLPIKHFFCGFDCKAAWQRRRKPVDETWLRQKYLVERVDCTQIAKLVGRNSKQVWQWLKGYGIPTRPRGALGGGAPTAWKKGQPSAFKGRSQPRGAASPHWKGGCTPDRQAFIASDAWRVAVRRVYGRANKTCERCGITQPKAALAGFKMHVHHIVPFAFERVRAAPANLALLCAPCHRFVHSAKNGDREFLPPFGVMYLTTEAGALRPIRINYRPTQEMQLPSWLLDGGRNAEAR